MCTVIITVPDDDTQPVRLLAVRDEDPGRPWDRLGAWWPDLLPGRGRHPRRPRGRRLARGEPRRATACRAAEPTRPVRPARRRGPHPRVGGPGFGGRPLARRPPARRGGSTSSRSRRTPLGSCTGTGWSRARSSCRRARTWSRTTTSTIPRRRASRGGCRTSAPRPSCSHRTHASGGVPGWRSSSAARSSPGDDEAAIIRRQSFEGIPSYSLVICVATVGEGSLDVRDTPLTTPGRWTPEPLG